eukprot:1788722-Rhodomonas_salina.1
MFCAEDSSTRLIVTIPPPPPPKSSFLSSSSGFAPFLVILSNKTPPNRQIRRQNQTLPNENVDRKARSTNSGAENAHCDSDSTEVKVSHIQRKLMHLPSNNHTVSVCRIARSRRRIGCAWPGNVVTTQDSVVASQDDAYTALDSVVTVQDKVVKAQDGVVTAQDSVVTHRVQERRAPHSKGSDRERPRGVPKRRSQPNLPSRRAVSKAWLSRIRIGWPRLAGWGGRVAGGYLVAEKIDDAWLGCVDCGSWFCLLYTSDAADDM